jgi:hypothetical protein
METKNTLRILYNKIITYQGQTCLNPRIIFIREVKWRILTEYGFVSIVPGMSTVIVLLSQ